MKKFGFLIMAVFMLCSAYAADVSAQVRIAGDIFTYDGTAVDAKDGSAAGSFSFLRAATQSQPWWTPYITLSASTEEAGTQIKFITGKDGTTDIKISDSLVWFKPFDFLTIQAGYQDVSMNEEPIDVTTMTGIETFGYSICFEYDAFSSNLVFETGNGPDEWFFQDSIAAYGNTDDPLAYYLKDLYFNLAYAADFGTISAMFEYQGKKWDFDSDDGVPTGFSPDSFLFGAGYNTETENLTFFTDVVGVFKPAITDSEKDLIIQGLPAAINAARAKALASGATLFEIDEAVREAEANFEVAVDHEGIPRDVLGIGADLFLEYVKDALKASGYIKFTIDDCGYLDNQRDVNIFYANNTKLCVKFKTDYKLDSGVKLFFYFASDNLLQKETAKDDTDRYKTPVFASVFKLGASGSVGICAWKTYFKLETGSPVTYGKDAGRYDKYILSMPLTLTVKF